MLHTISQDKLFKILEWILFIGFVLASVWFASGGLQHYFSRKTSFSQSKEKVTDYPIVNIQFGRPPSEIKISDVIIRYWSSGMAPKTVLKLGENLIHNGDFNKTEKVILESFENKWKNRGFRIIHTTPILEKNLAPNIKIQILVHNVGNQTYKHTFRSDLVRIYITSLKNSPGSTFYKWKDGKQLEIKLDKNFYVEYNIQPQITKYLEEMDECQEVPYYECIASQLDTMKFNECPIKCIPNTFSNLGRNYNKPFCQNDSNDEYCAFEIIKKINEHEIASYCKKACFNLEYFGEVILNTKWPYNSHKNWHMYHFRYALTNTNFESMVYEEYFIYDTVGMIGSVGGTFGIFLSNLDF